MYEKQTDSAILSRIVASLPATIDTREGSYTRDVAAPLTVELAKVYGQLDRVLNIAFSDTSAGEYIDLRAEEYGIYRHEGTRAQTELTFSGVGEVPQGTMAATETGLKFVTVDPGLAGTVIKAQAAETGRAYNVNAGEINRLVGRVKGITGVSGTEATGGGEPETDDELTERLYKYLRYPAASGNIYDYENWALAVEGVGAVKVLPTWNGPGTVKLLLADGDGQPAAEAVVAACAAAVEEKRPVGAVVTVEQAEATVIDIEITGLELKGITSSEVKTAYAASLGKYLKKLAFGGVVHYTMLCYLLLDIEGVVTYESLLVNGVAENVAIGQNAVAVMGALENA